MQSNKGHQRGAALIFALTLLTLFAVLGTSYVVSMSLELDEADLELREARAGQLAEAGVQAAIGELSVAVRAGNQGDVVVQGEKVYEFPAYQGMMTQEGYVLESQPRVSNARVVVSDESGKLNLNHAPASMLRMVLNVDGATARKITSSLPLPTIFQPEKGPGRQWLAGVDELLSRNLLSEEQYAAVDTSLLTTLSVANHARPERFLNVNTAPAEVLAALFDVSVEQAKQAMVRRPFTSLADLEAAAGKGADTFTIRPEHGDKTALPAELSLDSRCFRIESTGTYALDGHAMARRATRRLEAVVVFEGDGTYTITSWTTGAEQDEPVVSEPEEVEAGATVPAGDGGAEAPAVKEEDSAASAS